MSSLPPSIACNSHLSFTRRRHNSNSKDRFARERVLEQVALLHPAASCIAPVLESVLLGCPLLPQPSARMI